MCHGMRKPKELKLICHDARPIDINEYYADLPGSKASNNTSKTELEKTIFKSMPNRWSKQVYVKGFILKILL